MTTRLLVFDDDAAIGRLVTRVAVLGGLAATAVTDTEAFRQSLQQDSPHIVVLDLQLGGTDGVEQLRYLAERQYGGTLILMSGFDARVLATTCALAQGMGLNVATTLAKPIRVEELEQALERLQSVAAERPSTDRFLEAIRNDELILEFQPIVSRRPKTLKKLEALIRWEHPTIGRIPPSEFLPTAEADTAVIDALTDWVVGAALEAYLVLDRSFVDDVTTSRDARAIVKSIIDLAANMEMDCVAEGVETEETAAQLEVPNVGALQGYLIAKPMLVEAIPVWLAGWLHHDKTPPLDQPPAGQATGGRGDMGTPHQPGQETASPLSARQIAVLGGSVKPLTLSVSS